jgi:hypothetical protein
MTEITFADTCPNTSSKGHLPKQMGEPVNSAGTSLHFSITIPAMVEITGDPLNTIAKQEGN